MTYNYNREFQIIDNSDKAYLLGLFYSDGYVTYNTSNYDYFSGITLIKSDKELFDKVLHIFPFFSLKEEKNNVSIRINQRKACEDLILNGVLQNKSSINKNNLKFPKISSSLVSHFIRGVFDGDGAIYLIKKDNLNQKVFSITCNNYSLIKKIQEILFYNSITTRMTHSRGGESIIRGQKVIFNSICFNLLCTKREDIEKLSKFLYRESNLHLQRKFVIFNTWGEKIVKPQCPKCYSYKTAYLDKPANRIQCYTCKKSSYLNGFRVKKDTKNYTCNRCNSTNLVHNGVVKSRTDKKIIGFKLVCKDCNKCNSIKSLAATSLSN